MAGPWTQYQAQPGEGKPWERYRSPAPAAPAKAAPAAPKEQQGVLSRIWDTLTSPSGGTTGGRVKMGIGDPALGLAQIASRAYVSPMEGGDPDITPEDTSKAADQLVQRRERQYQQQRRMATPGIKDPEVGMTEPKLGMDWARLVGNVASPVNALTAAATGPLGAGGAAAGRAAPLAARLLPAARAGAIAGGLGGASMPVTEPVDAAGSFARQKLAQAGLGAAGGAVAGAAAPAIGAGARAMFGRPAGNAADQAISQQFARGVGIPRVNTQPQLAAAQDSAASAVRSIVANKDNLRLTGPGGTEVEAQLPQTRGQFSEAVHQTKESLFNQFDKLAKAADTSVTTEPSAINKFNDAFQTAHQKTLLAQQNLAHTNRRLTQAVAKQSQAGNVYSRNAANTEFKEAKAAFDTATTKLDQAQTAQELAQKNLSRPWVDLKPITGELLHIANDPVTRLTSRDVQRYALQKAEEYGNREALSGSDAQRAIKNLNSSLNAFYQNPSYDTAARASVDAMIANKLRTGLDEMINKATGAAYQPLKNRYGALSAIEKQVTNAARRGLNQEDNSLFSSLLDANSAIEVLHGLATFNPSMVTRGILSRFAKYMVNRTRSPDTAIANMFRNAERSMQPPPEAGIGIGSRYRAAGAGATSAGVGDRGPYGGTITHVRRFRDGEPIEAGVP